MKGASSPDSRTPDIAMIPHWEIREGSLHETPAHLSYQAQIKVSTHSLPVPTTTHSIPWLDETNSGQQLKEHRANRTSNGQMVLEINFLKSHP